MKYTYWQKRKQDAKRLSIDIAKVLTCLTMACTVSLTPCYAQQIIIDGNTATTLNTNGTVTDVTTTTTKGSNAFNSFTKFNVDAGNTVNLVVPDASDNLINIVTGEQTAINGVLNSIKQGSIGGNIFLANPNGIVIGAEGVVNVGSITAVTPTTDFTNNFFDGVGNPNDASITALIDGTAPINADAAITVVGKINAITNVTLEAGTVTNYGEIYTNADFGLDIETGDIVNLNSLEYAEHHAPENLVLENGEIKIKASSAINQLGGIYAGGDIELTSEVDLLIGGELYPLGLPSETYSGNGDIDLYGYNHVRVNYSYITSGGNLSITQEEYKDDHYNALIVNSTIKAANNVDINCLGFNLENYNNYSGDAAMQVPTLLESGGNVTINTHGVVARDVKAYGDILINANEGDAYISAESTNGNIEINCTNFELSNLYNTYDHHFDPEIGIITDYSLKAAGDITINAQYNFIVDYANIRAGNDITINAALNPELSMPDDPYLAILGNSNIVSTGGNISLNYESNYLFWPDYLRYGIAGDYQLGYLSSPTIEAAGNIDITATNNIDITGGATLIGDNITLTSPSIDIGVEARQYYDIYDPETTMPIGCKYNVISPSGATIEANSLTITQLPGLPAGDPMYPFGFGVLGINDVDITTTGLFTINKDVNKDSIGFNPRSINAGSFSSNFIAPNSDIILDGSAIGNLDHITIGGAPFNPGNITLVNGELWGDITTTGDVNLTDVFIFKDANLNLHSDGNITINVVNPYESLWVSGGNISANGLLTINASNVLTAGIRFTPDSITAGSLSSDFLVQNGDINIVSNKSVSYIETVDVFAESALNRFGNLGSITIGGAPLNPTNITIDAGVDGQIALCGDITTTGNISLSGKWLQLDDTASLNAGGNISINPTGKLDVKAAIINTPNQLTVNKGNVTDDGLIFTPESITAGNLVSDFITINDAITLASNESINVANLNAITIGGSGLNTINLTLNAGEIATIGGAITVSNDITLTGKKVEVSAGSTINAGNNLTLDPSESIHVYGGDITVTNQLTLNRGGSSIQGLHLQADSITVDSLVSDFLVQNGDLDLSDLHEYMANGNDSEVNLLNLDNSFMIGGNPLNLSNLTVSNYGSGAPIILGNISLTDSLQVVDSAVTLLGDITTGGSVNIDYAGKVVIMPDTTITAGEGIVFDYNHNLASISFIIGANSILDAQHQINITGSSEILNKLTIEPGVELTANGTLNLFNFTNITLDNVDLYAGGNTYVEYTDPEGNDYWADVTGALGVVALHDINITGGTTIETDNNNLGFLSFDGSINIDEASTITSGNDITFAYIEDVNIEGNSTLNAFNDINITMSNTANRYVQDKIVSVSSDSTLTAGNDVTISADREILLNGAMNTGNLTLITSKYGDIHSTDAGSLITTKDITLSAEYGKIEGINVGLTASEVNATAFNNIEISELDSDIDVGIITSKYGDVILSTAGGSILLDADAEITAGRMVDLDADQDIVVDGIVNAGYNLSFKSNNTITVDGAILSTRVIGASTDYANAASIANSGNITFTAPEITIQNGSEIYAHADNGFTGGDITLNADAILLNGSVEAEGRVYIDNSTIKAKNITMNSSGGNSDDNSFAITWVTNNSHLTATEDITMTAIGGTAGDDAQAGAQTTIDGDAVLISGNDVLCTAIGGSAGAGTSYANTTQLLQGGTITAGGDVIFDSTGGMINAYLADAVININPGIINADGDIIFTATGGVSTYNSDARINIQNADFTSNGDMYFKTIGGNGTNWTHAYTRAFVDVDLNAGGSITFESIGGTGGSISSARAYVSNEVTLTAQNNISFIATATDAGHDAEVYISDNSSATITGNLDRDLIINADGSIDTVNSNIAATINATDINVGEITGGSIIFTAIENGGAPGEIYGDGTLIVSQGYQSIDIVNNSDLDLYLNNMDTSTTGQIIKNGTYTGSFSENITIDNTPKDITITNNANSNILLAGNIVNDNGDVYLESPQMITLLENASINGNDIKITANTLQMNASSVLDALNDILFIADNYTIDLTALITAGNNVVFSRATAGDIELSDIGNLPSQFINAVDGDIAIGNHVDTNDFTNNINVNANIYTDGNDIVFKANDDINVYPYPEWYEPSFRIISTRDLNDVINDDHETALSQGDSGNISFEATNINIVGNLELLAQANNGFSSGTIIINPNDYLNIDSSSFSAGNIIINSGDINVNGIIFNPKSIIADLLTSDFLNPGNDLNLSSIYGNNALLIGNLDNIIINNNPIQFTNINITADYYSISTLTGNITTPGDITINAGVDATAKIYNGNITAGGDITLLGMETKVICDDDTYTINADNISFNPTQYLEISGGNFIANDSITINSGNLYSQGVTFNPDSIEANTLISDFIQPNASLNLAAYGSTSIYIGNLDHVLINNQPLGITNLDLYGPGVCLFGDISVPGDINLYAEDYSIVITDEANISAENIFIDVEKLSCEFKLDENSSLFINNETTINTYDLELERGSLINSNGKITINANRFIEDFYGTVITNDTFELNSPLLDGFSQYGINFKPAQIIANDLISNFMGQNQPININTRLSSSLGNLDNIIINGNPLNPSSISIVTTDSKAYLTGNITTSGDILISTQSIYSPSYGAYIDNNSIIKAGGNISLSSDYGSSHILKSNVMADGDIILNSPNYTAYIDDSTVTAKGNIVLSSSYSRVFIDDSNIISDNNIDIIGNNDINIEIDDTTIQANNVNITTSAANVEINGNSEINANNQVNINAVNIVDIDGSIIVNGNNYNLSLLVNADGTIDPSSNIGATIADNNIDVENLTTPTIAGINITAGSVTGTGSLQVSNGYADIDITNNSDNSLTINDLDTKTTGQIIINSTPVTEDVGGISVVFDPTYNGSGVIDVINNTASNILIAGNIVNEVDSVNVTNVGGSILDDGGLITAPDINLIANNGSIGTIENPINIDLTASTLNATALNDINISELDSDIDVINAQSTNGDVYLETSQTIILLDNGSISGNDINLTANVLQMNVNSVIDAQNDALFIADNYTIDSTALITANNVIFSRLTAGDIEISDAGTITPHGIDRVNGNIIIGNHADTNNLTNDININSNVYTDGNPITFNAGGTITVLDDVIISSRDLEDVWSDDHGTATSDGNSGDIKFNSNNLTVNSGAKMLAFKRNSSFEGGLIEANIINNLNTQGYFSAKVIDLNANTINSNGSEFWAYDDNNSSNYIYMTANNLNLTNSTKIISNIDVALASDNYTMDSTTIIGPSCYAILSRATSGNIEISDTGLITPEMIRIVNSKIQIGNYFNNDLTENITIKSNIYTDGLDIILVNNGNTTLDNNIMISTRNLNDVWIENHLTALSQDNSGTLFFATDGDIELKESSAILANANNGFTEGRVTTLFGAQNISTSGLIKADRITLAASNNVEASGDMIADDSLVINSESGNITKLEGSLIAPTINLIANSGSIGTADNYINVNSNDSTISISANGNIYLDSLYGSNSYSLVSTTGISYLKMHSNNPEPISNIIPTPPVVEVPIVNNLPQEIVVNIVEQPVIEDSVQDEEVIENTIPEIVNNEVKELDQSEIVINTPVEETIRLEDNVIYIDNNVKIPVKSDNIVINTINQPVVENITIDNTIQVALNKAIITYNEALLTGIDSSHAIDMAIDILVDANITKEDAKELIDNELIIDSAYLELLEQFVLLNKLSMIK